MDVTEFSSLCCLLVQFTLGCCGLLEYYIADDLHLHVLKAVLDIFIGALLRAVEHFSYVIKDNKVGTGSKHRFNWLVTGGSWGQSFFSLIRYLHNLCTS